MNGQDMFRGLNYVNPKFIIEAETVMQFRKERKILSLRRPILIAAIVALLLMLVGCTVAYMSGFFEIILSARSDVPLSEGQLGYIQENELIINETQHSNEWTVELMSTMTDSRTGYILFAVTAPTDIDLEGYFENHKNDVHAPYITPGNYSMRAGHRAIVIASTGFSDVELNFMWNESGHWESDNDGLSNTLNYLVELRCDKLDPSKECHLTEPFGKDITFSARFFDFTLEYEDEEIRESIEAKLTDQGDSLIGGEELQGLHQTAVLVKGEWIFNVSFAETSAEMLELITEPVTVKATVHRKVDNGTMFYDTTANIEEIQIISFTLTPMGAEIMYDQEEEIIGIFLEYEGTEQMTICMCDGSRIPLNSNGTGYTWSSDVPIILEDVDYVALPDGTVIRK